MRTARARDREMYELRVTQGLTLRAIGERFELSPERVRQLINRHVRESTAQLPEPGALSRAAREIRRAGEHGQAQARTVELLAARRDGENAQEIAGRLGLRIRCVSEVIRTSVTDADRATGAHARRSRRTARHRGGA